MAKLLLVLPVVAGNSANAALAAAAAVTSRLHFTTILLHPQTANIRSDNKLTLGDFGIVFANNMVVISKVLVIYARTGGLNGRHAAHEETKDIAANPYIGVQVFEQFSKA
ncbi:hypothetical protein BDQ17DRAFT_1435442 [Cyathus striatus]|nr:hypothetical protein BDQ17DRAFT_1435442 [Cyathus striatus]